MPLIILGLLVIAGLVAYMYFSGRTDSSNGETPKGGKKKKTDEKDESATVIYLPTDIEKEKKKRKVKTGK